MRGRIKKDCPKWKAEKGKDKEEGQSSKGSNVKIKEINVACIDEDQYILSTFTPLSLFTPLTPLLYPLLPPTLPHTYPNFNPLLSREKLERELQK